MQEQTDVNGPVCTRKSMHFRDLGVDRAWDVVDLVQTGKKVGSGEKPQLLTFSGSETRRRASTSGK